MSLDLKKYDIWLIGAVGALTICGFFMVFSSSYIMAGIRWSNNFAVILKQAVGAAIGIIVFYLTAFKIDYSFYQRRSKILYLIVLSSLIAVLFVGIKLNGSRRWIDLGLFTIQPSEFAKIIMTIIAADVIARRRDLLPKSTILLSPLFYVIPLIITIALQPDSGAYLSLVAVLCIMFFCAGVKLDKYIVGLAFLCIAAFILDTIRKGYRIGRLSSYIPGLFDINQTLRSAEAAAYQLKLSFFALGSGGPFLGKGPGNSDMKLMYLPEAHTDFIFSIIGEEFGFIGAAFVIGLFFLFFLRGIKIAKNAPDDFVKYLALGITVLIIIQTTMNIGVALGLLPNKGLALPFISAGGTSLVANMAAAGILVNLSQYSRRRKNAY